LFLDLFNDPVLLLRLYIIISPRERNNMGNPCLCGKIILKWILEE